MTQRIIKHAMIHDDTLAEQFDAIANLQNIFPGIVKPLGPPNLFGSSWINSGDWVDNGNGTWSINSPSVNRWLYQNIDSSLDIGKTYETTFEVTAYSAGDYRLIISGNNGPPQSGTGIKTRSLTISSLGTFTGILAVGGSGLIMTVKTSDATCIDIS